MLLATLIIIIAWLWNTDTIAVDELTKQVSGLSVSLMSELSCTPEKPNSRSEPLSSEDIVLKRVCSGKGKKTLSSEDDVKILDSATLVSKEEDPGSVVVLSDDEKESKVSACDVIRSYPGSSLVMSYGKTGSAGAAKTASQGSKVKKNEPEIDSIANMLEPASFVSRKLDSDKVGGKQELAPLVNSKVGVDLRKEVNSKCTSNDTFPPEKVSKLKKSDGTLSSNIVDSFQSQQVSDLRNSFGKTLSSKSIGENKASETRDIVIKELVRDAEDDPWELGLKSARRQDSSVTKINTS
ncbi:hypothetical protein RJ639_007653 [Escallonia herrerae]|uniref:Uncharacterized protein n=1 Tax=Escallonia herrerae TaxID=1293975 RepID=A0AA89AUP1_9ASTE|nr:hypothetical protein RJ639_007653 [Escallonia herrerae]